MDASCLLMFAVSRNWKWFFSLALSFSFLSNNQSSHLGPIWCRFWAHLTKLRLSTYLLSPKTCKLLKFGLFCSIACQSRAKVLTRSILVLQKHASREGPAISKWNHLCLLSHSPGSSPNYTIYTFFIKSNLYCLNALWKRTKINKKHVFTFCSCRQGIARFVPEQKTQFKKILSKLFLSEQR